MPAVRPCEYCGKPAARTNDWAAKLLCFACYRQYAKQEQARRVQDEAREARVAAAARTTSPRREREVTPQPSEDEKCEWDIPPHQLIVVVDVPKPSSTVPTPTPPAVVAATKPEEGAAHRNKCRACNARGHTAKECLVAKTAEFKAQKRKLAKLRASIRKAQLVADNKPAAEPVAKEVTPTTPLQKPATSDRRASPAPSELSLDVDSDIEAMLLGSP